MQIMYTKTDYCSYKPQKEPHLTNCFTIPFINTITRRTCWVLALLSLSICTLSLLLSVRIVHNLHNLCNVHVEYFEVYYCRLYMDSLTQEWRIISTFQFLNFLCRFRFALSKHFWSKLYQFTKQMVHASRYISYWIRSH